MDTARKRILYFIEKQNIKPVEFLRATGLKKGFIDRSHQESGATDLNISKILESYPELSAEWILTGKGKMVKSLNDRNQVNDKREIYQKTGKTIPLIPVEAFAGNGGGEVSIKEGDIQERYVIPDFVDVDFMIRVKGSSMYPKYTSGDIIACKIIKERSFFQWGRVFVIHHREQGTMIKRLFPANGEEVECKSDNPGYPPFKISLEEITNIALVKGVVRLE